MLAITRRIVHTVTVFIAAGIMLVALFLLMNRTALASEGSNDAAGLTHPLIVGTSLNPTGTNHDVFEIDVINNLAQSLLPTFPVGGATFDAANNRVLFTSSSGSTNIDQLWEWPVGGTLNNLGTIMDVTGGAQRMDGLAMSGGTLYGSYAGATAEDGLWTIDPTTLMATLVFPFSDSVSGIDADPITGEIYGVNDTTGNLVLIDPAGSMSPVTAYPAGQADIDGLAVGNDGRAYLVTDEPGSLYVYNLAGGTYETPLTAPWTFADTFSGAAFIFLPIQPAIDIEKTPDDQTVVSGGDANFTIAVTNTGDVTLTNVTVFDLLVPDCSSAIGTMPISSSISYGCMATGVMTSFTNIAVVTSTVNGQIGPTDNDDANVTVLQGGIDIEKAPDNQTVASGGDAMFTITVTNTGAADLVNVTVSDALVPDCDSAVGALAAGASVSYGCTAVGVAASFTNTAVVTSTIVTGAPGPSDSDDAVVTVMPPTDVTLTGFGSDAVGLFPLWPALLLLLLALGLAMRRRLARS